MAIQVWQWSLPTNTWLMCVSSEPMPNQQLSSLNAGLLAMQWMPHFILCIYARRLHTSMYLLICCAIGNATDCSRSHVIRAISIVSMEAPNLDACESFGPL